MSEFKGTFGLGEIVTVFVVLILSTVFFIMCWNLYFLAGEKQFATFSATVLGSLCLFLIALPMLSHKIDQWMGESLTEFLALQEKGAKITYPVCSQFLGEQALAGFMGSAMMLSARTVLENTGPAFTGVYCFVILMLAIIVATFSLTRFVLHLTKFKGWVYALASSTSVLAMVCALAVGLKSVTP